jgi:alanine dehydrogenase
MDSLRQTTVGFPRMHVEPGERRDFLPELTEHVAAAGAEVRVEAGIGSGMGLSDADYESRSPLVRVTSDAEAYDSDIVVVLRAPDGRYGLLRSGATLVSMLHYDTRPGRVRELRARGLDAISLDGLIDDEGRRVVENLAAVAWNGLDLAFGVLERRAPRRLERPSVLVLGAGAVGKHAVEAALKAGSLERAASWASAGRPMPEVAVAGSALSADEDWLRSALAQTDILVDAAARHDPSRPIVANALLDELPAHAVICDLAVDPYTLDAEPVVVRGIEGIPQGSLDQQFFEVDDPAWDRLPSSVSRDCRRAVVSCYSWPGVVPRECMEVYGRQLEPLLVRLVALGGAAGIDPAGDHLERALWRASLRAHTAA